MFEVMLLGVVVVLACALIVRRLSRPKRSKKTEPAAKSPERLNKEEELLARLRRVRRRADRAASAIDSDPERAAKVVRTMMKDRTKLEE